MVAPASKTADGAQEQGSAWWCNGWVLFTLLAAYQSLWIFQGLDVSDFGFHLTNQVEAFPQPRRAEDMPVGGMAWFLSDYVGGMWLAALGRPSLLWARLGGVLVHSLTALVSFCILSAHFDRRRVFLTVLICAALLTSACLHTCIHYYSFPALLLGIELWVLTKLWSSVPGSRGERWFAVILGFLMVPIVLARLPLLVFVALLPPVLCLYGLVTGQGLGRCKRHAAWVAAGLIGATGIFAAIYACLGILRLYLGSVFGLVSGSLAADAQVIDHHHIPDMVRALTVRGGKMLALAILQFVVLLFLWFLKERVSRRGVCVALATMVILGSIWGALHHTVWDAASRLTGAMASLALVLAVLFFRYLKVRERQLGILVAASLLTMLTAPIGTDGALETTSYGMWVTVPLVFLIANALREETSSDRVTGICSLYGLVLWLLIPVALVFSYGNLFRDGRNRLRLRSAFQHKALRWIHSSPERVAAVDSALAKIGELTERGDAVLMINDLGLFHYLTGTRPFLGTPCPTFESMPELQRRVLRRIEQGEYPKLFVCTKADTSASSWPNNRLYRSHHDMPKIAYLKAEYVEKLGYTLVWDNVLCEIYVPPPELFRSESTP